MTATTHDTTATGGPPGIAGADPPTIVLDLSLPDTVVIPVVPGRSAPAVLVEPDEIPEPESRRVAAPDEAAARPRTLADVIPAQRAPETVPPGAMPDAEPDPEPEDGPAPPASLDDADFPPGAPVTVRAVVAMPPGSDTAVLMAPPGDDELVRYRKRRLGVLIGASLISFGCLVASQVQFLAVSPWTYLFVPVFAFTVAYYLISLVVNIGTPAFDMERHRRLVADWAPAEHPSVDVFLPVCGEPLPVLHNTWRHVHRMAVRYPGRVHVYVLDDSASAERRDLALAFGFVHQRRPNRGWFKKAGNMRYAYQRTLGEHILVLDADFTPRADLLDQLLPYLDADPELGIIQSPQYFRVERNRGWLERGAAAVQELFYRSVQVSRQHHEAAICVGSCAIYRRAALDAIGGSTLIEHSEDVHTGFDMRRKGWRLRYVPVPLAVGLCPSDLNSFFTQQYRWCAGSMSLLGSTKFWNTRMRLRQRMSYLSGFCYYVHTALFVFAGPLVPIVLLGLYPQFVRLENYLLIVPSILYNFVVFPLWHRCRYRFETWTVKMVYGWAHAFAIWDLLRGQTMGWQPTGGTGKKSRTGRLRIGITVWGLGTALLWTLLAADRMRTQDLGTFVPALLAGTVYLATVLQALMVDPVGDVPRKKD